MTCVATLTLSSDLQTVHRAVWSDQAMPLSQMLLHCFLKACNHLPGLLGRWAGQTQQRNNKRPKLAQTKSMCTRICPELNVFSKRTVQAWQSMHSIN